MKLIEKDEIKLLILLIVIVTATILVMFVAMNVGNLGIFFGNNILTNSANTNYNETSNIAKIDLNEKSNIKMKDILLEQNRIISIGGTSILTTKVVNKGIVKDNLRFKVKFVNSNNSIVAEVIGYVGRLKTNETKYIDSFISKNISNIKNITYEIM